MSCELLLQDLRQKSAHKVAALWRQAEEDAAALRAGQERELAAERALLARQLAETGRQVAEPIIRAAEIQALRILDDAWRTLAERLARLAAGQLGQARQSGYLTQQAQHAVPSRSRAAKGAGPGARPVPAAAPEC